MIKKGRWLMIKSGRWLMIKKGRWLMIKTRGRSVNVKNLLIVIKLIKSINFTSYLSLALSHARYRLRRDVGSAGKATARRPSGQATAGLS